MSEIILKRLSEPSTYAGLAGLAIIVGLNNDEIKLLGETLAGIFSFLAILMGETKMTDGNKELK
jgi:hypothetical protein